jgi:Putative lumazine-binding
MTNDWEDDKAVLNTVESFLDGIRTRDREAMFRHILPEGCATLLRNGKPLHMTLRGVVERIEFDAAIVKVENIHDPVIRIDRDIAMAWTPYQFFYNDMLHHFGTNIFTLLRRDRRWLISGLADYSCSPQDVSR